METVRKENSIGTQIGKTFRVLRHTLQREFINAGYNLTLEQWLILLLLKIRNNRSQYELGDACDKEKTTITRIIDNLYKHGFVKRVQDENNRRSNIISITEKGYEAEKVLTPIAIEINKKALKGFSQEEIELFFNMMNRIINNLNEEN